MKSFKTFYEDSPLTAKEAKPTITTAVLFEDEIEEEEVPIVEEVVEEKILPVIKQADGGKPRKGDTELDGDATVVDKAPGKKDAPDIETKPKKKEVEKPKEKKPKMKPKDYLMTMLGQGEEDPTQ